MSETVIVVPNGRDERFVRRVREIYPDARVVSRDQARADAGLLARAAIAYGHLSRQEFDAAENLCWWQMTSAGAPGWIQEPAVVARDLTLTNSHIHASQISEHLFGMLLMLTHRLAGAWENQKQGVWRSPPGVDAIVPLAGRKLCVLGLGVIGQACAKIGKAMGMRVVGVRRTPAPDESCEQVFGPENMAEALAGSDVVMNLLPGTAETRGIIGAAELALLADGAIVLNAGRGYTMDTDALVSARAGGKLGGACLDVTEPEPLPPGHPLWQMPEVLITAHYSGNVADYGRRTDEVFLANLRRFRDGEPLSDVVDAGRGY